MTDDGVLRRLGARGRAALRRPEALLALAVVALALAIRYRALGFRSEDYVLFLQPWAGYIRAHGGFHALGDNFADYNVPYLYLLTGMAYVPDILPVTLLTAIKLTSVAFDAVLAFFVYRIVALRHRDRRIPLLAALVVFVLPTVVVNGAVWGQCDSIYAALGVAGLYYLLRGRPWLGCTLFGLAWAFKQQAVFLFPVLLVLLLARRLPWRALLAVPAAYLVLAVPALLAGRPLGDLLAIYLRQADKYPVTVLNAPSVWTLMPVSPAAVPLAIQVGVLFTAVVFLVLAYVLVASRVEMTTERTVLLATTAVILAPFLLPGMHERYFFLADVLTVVAAFFVPRRLWFTPLAIQAASLMSYVSFLFGTSPPGGYPLLTLLVLAAATAMTYVLLDRRQGA